MTTRTRKDSASAELRKQIEELRKAIKGGFNAYGAGDLLAVLDAQHPRPMSDAEVIAECRELAIRASWLDNVDVPKTPHQTAVLGRDLLRLIDSKDDA